MYSTHSQKLSGDFAKFCGLVRMYELYHMGNICKRKSYLWLFATHYFANPILSHKKFEFKIKFNLVLGYQISAFAASGLLTNLNGKGKKDRGYNYWLWGFRLFEVVLQFLAFCKLERREKDYFFTFEEKFVCWLTKTVYWI